MCWLNFIFPYGDPAIPFKLLTSPEHTVLAAGCSHVSIPGPLPVSSLTQCWLSIPARYQPITCHVSLFWSSPLWHLIPAPAHTGLCRIPLWYLWHLLPWSINSLSWLFNKLLEGRSFVTHLSIPSIYQRTWHIVSAQYILINKILVEIWSVPSTEHKAREEKVQDQRLIAE